MARAITVDLYEWRNGDCVHVDFLYAVALPLVPRVGDFIQHCVPGGTDYIVERVIIRVGPSGQATYSLFDRIKIIVKQVNGLIPDSTQIMF